MSRSNDEFVEYFIDQMNFLKKSCGAFDQGEANEAARISVALRNLLKDKYRTVSALTHLGVKESIKYLDTSCKESGMCCFKLNNVCNSTFLISNIRMGLVYKEVHDVETYSFTPLFEQPNWQQYVDFSDWYSQIIYSDPGSSITLTREDLIMSIAEQDGGCHFDKEPDNKYLQFKQKDSLGLNVNGQVVVFKNNPAFVSLRQIAYEITKSVEMSSLLNKYL